MKKYPPLTEEELQARAEQGDTLAAKLLDMLESDKRFNHYQSWKFMHSKAKVFWSKFWLLILLSFAALLLISS